MKRVVRSTFGRVKYLGGWPAGDSLYYTSDRSLSPFEACNQQPARRAKKTWLARPDNLYNNCGFAVSVSIENALAPDH